MSSDIFARLDPPIFALTARHGKRESAMVATWVLSATLVEDRSRILTALSPDGFTAELIRASGRFVLHLLSSDQIDLVPRLGLRSGRDSDKLAGLATDRSSHGLPLIPGTCGYSACEVIDVWEKSERLVMLSTATERTAFDRPILTLSELYRRLPPNLVDACERQRKRDAERDRCLT